MTVEVRPASHGADATSAEASLVEDWLGLAAYLALAVTNGDETIDAARAELAAAVSGVVERRTLDDAADTAALRHGRESLTTALLQWAATHAVRSDEAA